MFYEWPFPLQSYRFLFLYENLMATLYTYWHGYWIVSVDLFPCWRWFKKEIAYWCNLYYQCELIKYYLHSNNTSIRLYGMKVYSEMCGGIGKALMYRWNVYITILTLNEWPNNYSKERDVLRHFQSTFHFLLIIGKPLDDESTNVDLTNWKQTNHRFTIYTISIKVKVTLHVCLFHAKTAEPIWMKFRTDIVWDLRKDIS